MNFTEKQLTKEYIFKGKIINVRRDSVLVPNGNTSIREIVEHKGGVCVAALTENNEILLVKQFRYAYGEEILEIPAGKRDSSNEDPLQGAIRELREETGVTAKNIFPLGQLYPTPGYCNEIIWIYGATDLTYGEQDLDENEFLNVEKIPFETAVEMELNGEIKDSKTQTAILKLKLLKDSEKNINNHTLPVHFRPI